MGERACAVGTVVIIYGEKVSSDWEVRMDLSFYKNRTVLITGHTGFKGVWMSRILVNVGARIIGYALEAPTNPSFFELSNMREHITSIHGDVRDYDHLLQIFQEYQPEIVIHMAAQPIVLESYKNPRYTYDVNVMGTVNVLECVRVTGSVRSFVNVTTDKVYRNREWEWGYRENEELYGFDPYSNSKSCSELVTGSYKNAFFLDETGAQPAITTARAGNVIGGGDFAADRIIPDCIRAAVSGRKMVVRNPYSTRPYQHVLEPVMAYLMIAKEQYLDKSKAGSYNVGPDENNCVTTGDLVTLFCEKWNEDHEQKLEWENRSNGGPHEANFLKLDSSKIKKIFGWNPVWGMDRTISLIIEWTDCYLNGGDIADCMDRQIEEYLNGSAQ